MLARHQQRKKRLLQAHDAVAVQGATLEDVYENSRVKFSLSLPLIGSFLSRDVHVSLPCWLDFQHLLFYHQKKSPLEYCIIEIFSCLNGGIRISIFLCCVCFELFWMIDSVFSNMEVKTSKLPCIVDFRHECVCIGQEKFQTSLFIVNYSDPPEVCTHYFQNITFYFLSQMVSNFCQI